MKSFTSYEMTQIFDKAFWIDLRSDFTMNSLKRYRNFFAAGVCLLVNDATLLLSSKVQRAKSRVIEGFSELLSDAKYIYQDFMQRIPLIGKVSTIWNITSEAFQNYKDRLFGSTLSERFLTVHYVPTREEKDAWVAKEEEAKKMHFGEKITVEDIAKDVEIPSKYLTYIKYIAQDYAFMSLVSPTGMQDILKAILRAHAALNKRSQVFGDDLQFVLMIQPYLTNPFSPYEGLIVKYRAQGLSYREIEQKLNKRNYIRQIERVVKKAELRGLLYSESPQNVETNNRLKRNGDATYG
jgi:hypothetical protein